MPPSVGTARLWTSRADATTSSSSAIRRSTSATPGNFPRAKRVGKAHSLACNLLENAEVRRERRVSGMANSILASPHAGIKSDGPSKLLAKTVAAVAIAVFWCISAVGTTVGTAVGTTVGVTTLAAAVTAATSTTAEAGRRRRRRRRRGRRGRGGPWFWYWWGPYGYW
jgi:hypothetical protein